MSFTLPRLALGSASASLSRGISPTRITFDTWDEGGVFDWYQELRHTAVHKLELRKEREGVKHEFILVYVDEGLVYRIDRRALGGVNPEAIALDRCEAEDSVALVSHRDLLTISSITEIEIVMEFTANKPDLYFLIAICVATLMDPQSRYYTLQYYNCYFLSRAIITITLRHCLLQCPPIPPTLSEGVRWDMAVAPVLSKEEIHNRDWSMLSVTVRTATVSVIERTIWPIIAAHAESHIKDWGKLQEIISAVINEAVMKSMKDLVGIELLIALYEEALGTAERTLWRESLGQNLAVPKYRGQCEVVVGKILSALATAHQEQRGLLDEMASRVEDPMAQSCFVLPEQGDAVTTTRAPATSFVARNLSGTIAFAQKLVHEHNVPEKLFQVKRKLSEKIPSPVMDKLPRELTRRLSLDMPERIKVLRGNIYEALTSWSLKNEVEESILGTILHKSEGELPQSIEIHVRKSTGYERVCTHAALQRHILDMTRKHSKMVALSKLKLDEESAYNNICFKTEQIWRAVRPHSVPSSRLKTAFHRITDAVKEGIHTMHMVGHDYIVK